MIFLDVFIVPLLVSHDPMIIITQDGIQPMWEDDRNKHGGRWLLNVDKKGPRPPIIDTYWVETVSHAPSV